jgi:hypothetical protein
MSQPDLFGGKPQGDLFGVAEAAPPSWLPDPARARARMVAILDEARAAEMMPWTASKLALYRTIFPQMSRWLTPDDAEQMLAAFEGELARLLPG